MYKALFPIGSTVCIASLEILQRHKSEWKYHHPLNDEQLGFAGAKAGIEDVSFYHGGDPLYKLKGASGIWHEACLTICDQQNRGEP